MTRQTQSEIVERVLAAYLAGWRLPSRATPAGDTTQPAESSIDPTDRAA